jgi:hypothetical protein
MAEAASTPTASNTVLDPRNPPTPLRGKEPAKPGTPNRGTIDHATPGLSPENPPQAGRDGSFSYWDCLVDRPKTLQLIVKTERDSGEAECNGVDTTHPGEPFTWDWGDGQKGVGFFPQKHRYQNSQRDYVITVAAHYPGGGSNTARVPVRFSVLSLPLSRPPLPGGLRVIVPAQKPNLRPARAPYGPSPDLTVFDDGFFHACTRETVEYVLTQAAAVQVDFANNDVCRTDARFDQVLLRDPKAGGMYSLWFTEPVAFGVGDYGFAGSIQWSSFFHEMGHNVTLNSPAKFHWGFKQDGPASTIYSETMAQIFQHATAYEMVNNARKYGLSENLAWDIAQNATASMGIVRRSFESYRENGFHFCSWNDPTTGGDDTFDTFMTVAYKFFEHAEKGGVGYREPTKRLMAFLQRFNPEWEKGFSAGGNSPAAERFRATLMTAALSHAFKKDLRQEFRELHFPVDDKVFRALVDAGAETGKPADSGVDKPTKAGKEHSNESNDSVRGPQPRAGRRPPPAGRGANSPAPA